MKMVEIGKGFGNMHHSTIVYATQQIEKKIQTDSNLKETIEDIMRNIRDN